MSMPVPDDNEKRHEFMKRCVEDPFMEEEFPDEDDRVAVCYRQWYENQEDDPRFPDDTLKENRIKEAV